MKVHWTMNTANQKLTLVIDCKNGPLGQNLSADEAENVIKQLGQGRVFLTGDFRRFNADQATWSGVTLKHNLEFEKKGDWNLVNHLGAWELAGNWSYTDLSDFGKAGLSGVLANRSHHFTVGLNWYWSERIRTMFNYTRIIPADKVGGHSEIDLFATALRYYF